MTNILIIICIILGYIIIFNFNYVLNNSMIKL